MLNDNNNEEFEIEDLSIIDFREPTPEEIERRKKEEAEELLKKGFLPKNDDYAETMTSPQEFVEKNPQKYIIEECIPACRNLWQKNIYTFMVSDHLNENECWIEVIEESLSEENKNIFMQLSGDDVIKFSYHPGCINFGVRCVGKEGQSKLLELANQFKMQDVPHKQAYLTVEEFLMDRCGCYDEVINPDYQPMTPPWQVQLPIEQRFNYIIEYDKWEDSLQSKKTIKKYNPNKINKPLDQLVFEHGMIMEDDRIYLSPFHYQKHIDYLNYLNDNKKTIHHK